MMKVKQLLVLPFILAAFSCTASKLECNYTGYVDNKEFRDLVCEAYSLEDQKKYSHAIKSLEKALSVPTHEIIYFQQFADLARLYYLNRQKEQYLAYLEKYKLSLAIFAEIAFCEIEGNKFVLKNKAGILINSKYTPQVADAMCGGEKAVYLDRKNIDRIDTEATYYKLYLDLKHLGNQ